MRGKPEPTVVTAASSRRLVVLLQGVTGWHLGKEGRLGCTESVVQDRMAGSAARDISRKVTRADRLFNFF